MRSFLKLSKTAATMCAVLGGLFLLLLMGGLLVIGFLYRFEQPLPYAIGLLIGCLQSVLKVILMERALNRSLDMEGKMAQNYASLQAILRYGLTIAVVLGVIFFPDVIGLFGTILGILSLQISAYITNIILKIPTQPLQ